MAERVEITGNIRVHHPVREPLHSDGYVHKRDSDGVCCNCGAGPQERHYRLLPRA